MIEDIDKANEYIISARDLYPYYNDRTLLYGYTCDRNSFHVYIKNKEIHTVIYKTKYLVGGESIPYNMIEINIQENCNYVPDKRLYPENCDFRFCKLLKEYGVNLPFTNYQEEKERKDFYGFTWEDI